MVMNAQPNTADRHDLSGLKARTDLRRLDADDLIDRIVARAKARGYKGNGAFINGPCLFPENHKHGDKKHSAGINLENGGLHCFSCGWHGRDEVAQRLGVDSAGLVYEPVRRSRESVSQSEPPDAIWQNAALKALKPCQDYLWSGRPDAQRALDYLHQRGFADETIRAAGLGFCPKWAAIGWKDADGKPAGVWPGIVIPIFYNGALWALRVREFKKSLKSRYMNVTGSKLTGALYNGDAIKPDAPLLIVEGEFDAMLAGQLLPELTVITPGPVSNTLTKRQLEHIRQASTVYILMDNDSAGQGAAQAATAAIGDIASILPALPAGKDVTEFVCEHGGDLSAWFAAATPPAPFPNGVPDKWRSILLNRKYFPDSFAVGLELLNEACRTGLIDPDGFTTADYLAANKQVGFNLSESTARQLLKQFVGVFLRDVDGKENEGNLPSTSQKNPGGRPTKSYRVLDRDTMRINMMTWIAPRLYEQYHPTGQTGKNMLAEVTPAMLRDAGVSDPDSFASELRQKLQAAFDLQENAQRWASQRATAHFERISRSLDDLNNTPLPTGWPLNNAKAYRDAFAHAVAGDGQRSRRELCDLLGVKNTALSAVLERAGIEQSEPQYTEVQISSTDDFERQVERIGRYTVKGMPCEVRAELPDGRVFRREYSPQSAQLAADTYAAGGHVRIKFRIANKQVVVRDTPPEPPAPREPSGSSGKSAGTPRIARHYGPTYNPAWLAGQYWLALKLLGWVQRGDDRLINPATGEVAHQDMKPIELIECILDRTIEGGSDNAKHSLSGT